MMAVREIVVAPDLRLLQVSEPIAEIDDSVHELYQDLVDTMKTRGVGIAAIQIGVPRRMFVIGKYLMDTTAFINPEIIESSEETSEMVEGCLSVRGGARVHRPARVTVRAVGIDGETFQFEATGLLATCIQHEYDHLNGVLITDRRVAS
jgi:peptide deformylase